MEEAIAELSEDWSYSGTTGQNLDKGIYDIAIDGSGDLKTIAATGKIGNIQRTIEAQVERTASYYNLSEMKDYAILPKGFKYRRIRLYLWWYYWSPWDLHFGVC